MAIVAPEWLRIALDSVRGHRHAQGGVLVALLRGTHPPALGVRVRVDSHVGARGRLGARSSQLFLAGARTVAAIEVDRRGGRAPHVAYVRTGDVQGVVAHAPPGSAGGIKEITRTPGIVAMLSRTPLRA